MRLFLAINLPSSVKEKLDQQLDKLKKDYPHFSWVAKENFHTTIHFFGETKNLEKIKKKIDEAVYDINSFRLYSQGADLFLNQKVVLYIYFRREKRAEEIASAIRTSLQIKEEKKFIPHLTIARSRIPSKQQYLVLKKKLHQLKIDIDFPVSKIYLMDSIMTAKKPMYKKIASFSLLKQHRS